MRGAASTALRVVRQGARRLAGEGSGRDGTWRVTGKLPASEAPVHPSQGGVFAVVEVGPHQHKVSPDDVIVAEKLKGADVNDIVELPNVLLAGTERRTVVGRPTVPGAAVKCLVEEQMRDKKKLIFKKKRRKHQENRGGHRQELTSLRILSVDGLPQLQAPS